jgi:hypothetical protein
MGALHHAALIRAYRTLAQGLGGSAVSVALIAIFTDGEAAVPAIGAALGTTAVAAFVSFWQGVAGGLPEAPEFTIEQADELFAAERAAVVPDEDGHVRWTENGDKGRHEA